MSQTRHCLIDGVCKRGCHDVRLWGSLFNRIWLVQAVQLQALKHYDHRESVSQLVLNLLYNLV